MTLLFSPLLLFPRGVILTSERAPGSGLVLWGPPPMLWPASSRPSGALSLLHMSLGLRGARATSGPTLLKPRQTGFFMEALHLSAFVFWPEIFLCVMGSFTLPHPLDPCLTPVHQRTFLYPLLTPPHPVPLSTLEAVPSPGDIGAPPWSRSSEKSRQVGHWPPVWQ